MLLKSSVLVGNVSLLTMLNQGSLLMPPARCQPARSCLQAYSDSSCMVRQTSIGMEAATVQFNRSCESPCKSCRFHDFGVAEELACADYVSAAGAAQLQAH